MKLLNEIPDTQLHQWIGAHPVGDGVVRFCVWSPDHDEIVVHLLGADRRVTLDKTASGYHLATVAEVAANEQYTFHIDGGPARPDPASRYQPDGVHGPSQIVETKHAWTDQDWQGVTRDQLVIYELHIGAFTAQGTFLSAIDRLDELVDLGITAIELMPVATSAGKWNWGYDGVNLFAPSPNYGTPHDLCRLVDAAHAEGLAVFLDVVYNHLGPEGNYLAEFGPYFSDRHTTPWGAAPNFDGANATQLRRFFVAAAITWLDEYHIDGLRVDAIHCMLDDNEPHIAAQISDAVALWAAQSGRPATLIAESNVYDPNMLAPRTAGGIGFDAEWCDDLLHSMFAVVRPGERVCHRQYEPTDLQQTLTFGFVYEGSLCEQRGRCLPTERIDTRGLIYSIQHHDFIGNHPLGKRLHQLTSLDTQRAAATLLLLSPAIPMLFMGEEFACQHAFRFFVDFGDQHLRQAVTEGRKSEYPQHDWSSGQLPTDPSTFFDSKIGAKENGDQSMWDWYQALLCLRKSWRQSNLICDANLEVQCDVQRGLYVMNYSQHAESGTVAVRLSAKSGDETPIPFPSPGELVLDSRGGTAENLLPNHAKVFRGVSG